MKLKPVRTVVPGDGGDPASGKGGSADNKGTGSGDHPVCCSHKINRGVIAGGTTAGVVVVVLCILGAVMLRKRRQRRKSECLQVSQDRARPEELSAGTYTGHGGEGRQYDHSQEGKDSKTPDFLP